MSEPLADGLAWPEGPSPLPDGRIAFVESDRGRVAVWAPERGVSTLAETGGRPNGTVVAADGRLYVAQSGPAAPGVADAVPGIQRVTAGGAVDSMLTQVDGRTLQRPNDIVVGPDGELYFTDPGRWDPVARPDGGLLCRIDRAGIGHVVREVGAVYPNGLGFDVDGRLLWVESYTRRLMRLERDGRVSVLREFEDAACVPDGICVLSSGAVVVAATAASGLVVVDLRAGDRFLRAGAVPTNCTRGGRWLYVTDGGATRTAGDAQREGSLWRIALDAAA